jgi:hypothetical protein
VTLNGATVVPVGTVVTGIVRRSRRRRSRAARRPAAPELHEHAVPERHARRHPLDRGARRGDAHRDQHHTRRGALGAILGGVLGGIIQGRSGAVVGAILGAGGAVVATKGQNVELPEGTHLSLRLDQATVLAMRE